MMRIEAHRVRIEECLIECEKRSDAECEEKKDAEIVE
jgi:hypothetical protein